MSTPLSRSQRVQHNSSGRMMLKNKQKGNTQEKPICPKCKTAYIHIFNANRNRMEKRCGCNPNET